MSHGSLLDHVNKEDCVIVRLGSGREEGRACQKGKGEAWEGVGASVAEPNVGHNSSPRRLRWGGDGKEGMVLTLSLWYCMIVVGN